MGNTETTYGTKGTHILKASEWVEGRLGPGAFKRIVQALGLTDPTWLHLSPIVWYPVEILTQILAIAGAEVGLSVQDVSKEVAELNAQHDLRTIYKFFMSVLGPVKVMSQTGQMFKTYVNFGEVRVVQNLPGYFEGVASGIPHRLTPWFNGITLGFLPKAIAAAGGKNPKGEILSGVRDEESRSLYMIRFAVHYQ